MSAFAWLISLAPLSVGSGQCLCVFFFWLDYFLVHVVSDVHKGFPLHSPQNGAVERFLDFFSSRQWWITPSESLACAHIRYLWNYPSAIIKSISESDNFSWRFLQNWERQASACWWAPLRQQEKYSSEFEVVGLSFGLELTVLTEKNRLWKTRIPCD